jgi:3-oxoacyl-[acyl-carrier-protein] synthase II
MDESVVITGIGMVTPLGDEPQAVLGRLQAGESAAATPTQFDASPFACPVCAVVKAFEPQRYVSEPKLVRLMNRDAQLAVAAAHLALGDAGIRAGAGYPAEDIALYGATGLAGLPLAEIAPLLKACTTAEGRFGLDQFGQAGLRAVSPILSFKILANMPVCFVSICENVQGPNAIYTPWEGQGAQAIEAGLRAVRCGESRCALVGGSDVKTRELAFLCLEQQGLFRSWKETRAGVIPAEGAVFLVLETERGAAERRARVHARLSECGMSSSSKGEALVTAQVRALSKLPHPLPSIVVGAAEADVASSQLEMETLERAAGAPVEILHPKPHVGNLFAAAAALQVALGALLATQRRRPVLAHGFGHGTEQAAFVLEPA